MYLCPNDLSLGKVTSRVPSGPLRDFRTRDYFRSLLIQRKWHTSWQNLCEGNVVLIQDANQIRGQWMEAWYCA